ncbi:hypothetical protein [Mangrovimonas sp. YM274]|uniref:hypothetical protein n=1 Tax=Mangrovimonas sp. YM274 TaxID=3070660 RepID=UPI0027DD844A|nr:hypothetical protein [Mangrovimonas sp. YM274]WMI68244.1 hypothetical protein RBH95_13975 [Mangrovimonas sp. YM274]
MKTKNFNYISIIAIGLVIALIGFLASQFIDNPEAEFWTQIGLRISEFVGFLMLLFNGTFIKTRLFKIAKVFIAIILIAALLKILHWNHNGLIMSLGYIGIVATYSFSFFRKPIKKYLDFLKLFWVFAAYTNSLLTYLHIISNEYQIISSVIMWLAIIDYMKTEREKRRLFD